MSGRPSLATLLSTLDVPRGGLLYVQSSADWLARAGFQAGEVLGTLREWIGPAGLLIMPAYPMRTTQQDYLQRSPVYDVARTPVAIGLLPELLRRSTASCRSLDPDFPVVAEGLGAAAAVVTDLTEADPFGPRSVYERLLDRGATLVGLGVSLNTNSFIHVIDSRLQDRYPVCPYDGQRYPTTVIDAEGVAHRTLRKGLRPEFQRLTEPSAIARVFPASRAFATAQVGDTSFFRWELRAWSAWCMEHAGAQLDRNDVPCWLRRAIH